MQKESCQVLDWSKFREDENCGKERGWQQELEEEGRNRDGSERLKEKTAAR